MSVTDLLSTLHPLAGYDVRAIMAILPKETGKEDRRKIKISLLNTMAVMPLEPDVGSTHFFGYRWLVDVVKPWPIRTSERDYTTSMIGLMLRKRWPGLYAKCYLLPKKQIPAADFSLFLAAITLWKPQLSAQGGTLP